MRRKRPSVSSFSMESFPNKSAGSVFINAASGGGVAPSNTVAPVISGSTSLGSTLSCTTGTWSGSPAVFTYSYQWKRNGTNIGGATSSTYVTVVADSAASITCVVTASNGVAPDGTATSNTLTMANYTPVISVNPVISGSTSLGSTLTTTNGTWTNSPSTFTYQWFRGASPISGATNSTYVTVVADSTASITCQVTASNGLTSSPATTNALVMSNYTPANTVPPAVSGTAVVGQPLTTTNGTWTNSPTSYTYQWYRGASAISGATSSTYVLVQADAGNTSNIKCVVTATNAGGSASADSNTVAQIIDTEVDQWRTATGITTSSIITALNFRTTSFKGIDTSYNSGAVNIWSKKKADYPIVGGSAAAHKYNLKNVADTDAAYRLSFTTGWSHASTGMTPSSAYADTFLIPNSVLGLNSKHYYIYSRTNNIGVVLIGALSTGPTAQDYLGLAFNAVSLSGAAAATPGASGTTKGFSAISRNNSTQILFKNANNSVQTLSNNSSANPTAKALLASGPAGTNYASTEYSSASIGDGLTSTELDICYAIEQQYQTLLSRQV